jgi:hypothetical protein
MTTATPATSKTPASPATTKPEALPTDLVTRSLTKPASKPARGRRPAAKSGNPQADRSIRDAAAAANAAVLNGVLATDAPDAPAKAAPARKPAAKKSAAPARKPPAKNSPEKANKTTDPKPPAPKVDIRASKQDLARVAVQAIADAIAQAYSANDPTADSFVATMSKADALKTASQWVHHLPCGTEDGSDRRWWAENFPRPVRSDWK